VIGLRLFDFFVAGERILRPFDLDRPVREMSVIGLGACQHL
jgi:hypothetical protein